MRRNSTPEIGLVEDVRAIIKSGDSLTIDSLRKTVAALKYGLEQEAKLQDLERMCADMKKDLDRLEMRTRLDRLESAVKTKLIDHLEIVPKRS
jgi:hypothetical protein